MVTRTRPLGEREVDASHAQAGDAACGLGESTAHLSWEGQTVIYENGVRPAETDRLPLDDQYAVADVDLDLLRQERQWMGTFDDNRHGHAACTDGSGALPSKRAVAYWGGGSHARRRIEALQQSSASVALFLEYIPQNLHQWLGEQMDAGGEAADRACAMVERAS